MPRFVVLFHKMPADSNRDDHWDFMLELDDSLATWALPQVPNQSGGVVAEPLSPHRKHYLDYEGPLSENRGEVSQWDAGTFAWLRRTDAEVRVQILGDELKGVATLKKVDCWHYQYEPSGEESG